MTSPKRLAYSLETLIKELSNWLSATRDFDPSASSSLKQEEEAVLRTDQRINVMVHQHTHNQESGKRIDETFTEMYAFCTETLHLARQTFTQVQEARVQVHMILQHWQKELSQAELWLGRSQERLTTAQTELQQKQASFRYTIEALQGAKEALYVCRNGTSPRGCFAEALTLQQSQVEMEKAQAEVRTADRELHDATTEEALAQARATVCMQTVELAQEAVNMADVTLQNAQQSVNYAERSHKFIETVRKLLQETQHIAKMEEEAVENMLESVGTAKTRIDEAKQHSKKAECHRDAAIGYALQAQKDLQRRAEQLRRLNSPDVEEFCTTLEKSMLCGRPKVVPFLGGLLSLRLAELQEQNIDTLPTGENDREMSAERDEHV